MRWTLVLLLVAACGDNPGGGRALPDGGFASGPDAQTIPPPPCATDDDCQDDTVCQPGVGCVPWGTTSDPTCTSLAVIGVFAPATQCEWTPAATDLYPAKANVLSTPMVADFDLDGDKTTLHPSLVFASYDGTDGGDNSCVGNATWFGVIRVVDGNTCATQATIDFPVIASSPVAIGDVDGDGRPDIVAHAVGGGLVAFGWDPAQKTFVKLWQSDPFGAGTCLWSGPSIHDLDDDGHPEVLMGAAVFDGRTGAALDTALGLLYVSVGQIPVVADLDGNGRAELVTGDAVYEWRAGKWALESSSPGAPGLVALGDFGTFGTDPASDDRTKLDGVPEIAVIAGGQARVDTIAGRTVFGPITLSFFAPATDPGGGGPPTIADFDGDGRAELAVAGKGGYTVFDPDCTGADPAGCATGRADQILWSMPTQDYSSSVTGSSVFDFEGDGQAEVVYADECFSRVYDGRNGDVLYSQYRTSCTWYENPVVADVDGDLRSEIVIPSNDNCGIGCPAVDPVFDGLRCESAADCPAGTACVNSRCRCSADTDCGADGWSCTDPIAGASPDGKVCRAAHPSGELQGVRVIRDTLDRWVNSRPIWNQHAYAITNVNDDGTIPRTSAWRANWRQAGMNNFRQNQQGGLDPTKSPDLTGRGTSFLCDGNGMTLSADVCNRGTADVGGGVTLTFYDPSSNPICSARTAHALAPGDCEAVSCVWTTPPSDTTTITAVVDPGNDRAECHEGNNKLTMAGISCTAIP